MRSRWNFPIYLAYLAISLTAIGFILTQVGFAAPWSHQYSVTAEFTDAADVLTNNEVYIDGIRVGHVGTVAVQHGDAHVQLIIDDAQALPLHMDASAEVRKKNLLGETYIDLQPGTGVRLMSDGGMIPEARTVPITEIDQVLAIFDPQTVQRVQLLINALGEGTANNGQNMNAEASSMNQLITALNGPAVELSVRQQQLQTIVTELESFYNVIAGQRGQIRDEFGTWNQVMAQLAAQDTSITGTLLQANTLLHDVNTLLSGETGNLASTLRSLPGALSSTNSFLTQANTVTGDLAPFRQYIDDTFPPLQSAFTDIDPKHNHLWSVYSVNCSVPPTFGAVCSGSLPASYQGGAAGDVWASFSTGTGS